MTKTKSQINYKNQIPNSKQNWILRFSIWCLFGIYSLCFGASQASAQFFQGIGITAGVTKAKQKWFLETLDIPTTKIVKKKNIIGFNGSIRAEFINSDYVRWVTEIQFNQKGCKDKGDSATYRNRLNYIGWNNFLKFQMETYPGFFYLMLGPRVEYNLTQATNSPDITGSFGKLNFSWGPAIGFEKIVFSNFKPFIELHYNPDTPFYYAYESTPLDIRNRAWELRIGIIYRPGDASCPTVVY